MSTIPEKSRTTIGASTAQVRPLVSFWRVFGRMARRNPPGIIGLFIVATLVLAAALADVVSPYPPNDLVGLSNQPPSSEYYLGTDTIGRDIFSRLMHGARVSLLVGFSAVIFGMTGGLFLGLVTGYLKGTLDLLVQRLVDTLEAFPGIVLALAIVAILGPGVWHVVLALAVGYLGPATRVTRSVVLRERERTYAEAARALGASTPRVMLVHVLPNSLSPFLVLVSIFVGLAIIAESSLSFLGAGVGPETASWGGMLAVASQQYFDATFTLPLAPGLAIMAAVMGFNMFADAIRDILDPKLRRR
jgi:peptide/nickel transport system permease protein